ncbi:MAG TPA: hypothetical protein VM938_07345 [Acidimicrobiales bacterium]|nr:hypothetical protein [Acidimicrobiales bacterium]
MDEHARALADAIETALPDWVVRCVTRLAPEARAEAEEVGRRAAAEVGGAVRELLAQDIDEQHSTPLTILRGAIAYPTEVLRNAGVEPVDRDPYSVERFPDDDYDLTPATFADIDPALAELGIAWGAAKAFAHKQRHGSA